MLRLPVSWRGNSLLFVCCAMMPSMAVPMIDVLTEDAKRDVLVETVLEPMLGDERLEDVEMSIANIYVCLTLE